MYRANPDRDFSLRRTQPQLVSVVRDFLRANPRQFCIIADVAEIPFRGTDQWRDSYVSFMYKMGNILPTRANQAAFLHDIVSLTTRLSSVELEGRDLVQVRLETSNEDRRFVSSHYVTLDEFNTIERCATWWVDVVDNEEESEGYNPEDPIIVDEDSWFHVHIFHFTS